MASLGTPLGQYNAAVGTGMLYEKTKSDWNTGDTRTRANIVGNVVGEIGIAVAGAKGVSSLTKSGTISEFANLTVKVQETANILKQSGQAPATVAGAILPNGAKSIETSGTIPAIIAPQLEEAASKVGGIGAKNGGNTVSCCSEFRVANTLLLENPQYQIKDLKITPAIRPRTGQIIPSCENCGAMFGNTQK